MTKKAKKIPPLVFLVVAAVVVGAIVALWGWHEAVATVGVGAGIATAKKVRVARRDEVVRAAEERQEHADLQERVREAQERHGVTQPEVDLERIRRIEDASRRRREGGHRAHPGAPMPTHPISPPGAAKGPRGPKGGAV